MTVKHLSLLPLLGAALCACELGSKNLSDSNAGSASTGNAGSGSSTAATSEPSTGATATTTAGGECQDPLTVGGVTRECGGDGDCAVVFHQTDCCGSQMSAAVNTGSVGPSNEAEAICAAMFPACECAPMPTTTEDGKSTENSAAIAAACVDGLCRSTLPAGSLRWYTTCGDPVCGGYTKPEGVEPCAPEHVEGAPCEGEGVTCDPMSDCNALLVCAAADPKQQPGGCPISRARFKTGIEYLERADLERHAADLQSLRLATYRYREAPAGAPPRLGIILEDNERGIWVDAAHDRVDLYGYTSLAVAALQVQQQQIAVLQAEVERLTARLNMTATCAP